MRKGFFYQLGTDPPYVPMLPLGPAAVRLIRARGYCLQLSSKDEHHSMCPAPIQCPVMQMSACGSARLLLPRIRRMICCCWNHLNHLSQALWATITHVRC